MASRDVWLPAFIAKNHTALWFSLIWTDFLAIAFDDDQTSGVHEAAIAQFKSYAIQTNN